MKSFLGCCAQNFDLRGGEGGEGGFGGAGGGGGGGRGRGRMW
ncbi:predicted protein [Sclerotinia sclerotiorum 1980 UF-70]|uniref:Uncharacterized protein n=1 Tax=Sclerotinia sclerotiorum (strain ATCC 18683 / 1980 / Ss-1) TaxID=665079 RepID=A7EG97_SCLS1|nr:predicted protein [Sclerotinia sclerotiorum 1980 UF-70]EDO01863.1 predicted protein [Sclerotinia sclerotiorum 1980 UF-70]